MNKDAPESGVPTRAASMGAVGPNDYGLGPIRSRTCTLPRCFVLTFAAVALAASLGAQVPALHGSAASPQAVANSVPPPLTLPSGLKGLGEYFPRGHAWWSMLYDWYTLDCTTTTLPQSECSSGKYVYQLVQTDLQICTPVALTLFTCTFGTRT